MRLAIIQEQLTTQDYIFRPLSYFKNFAVTDAEK